VKIAATIGFVKVHDNWLLSSNRCWSCHNQLTIFTNSPNLPQTCVITVHVWKF